MWHKIVNFTKLAKINLKHIFIQNLNQNIILLNKEKRRKRMKDNQIKEMSLH